MNKPRPPKRLPRGPRIDNPDFRRAVRALSSGDLESLRHLLDDKPELVAMRAEEDGAFAGAYFSHPYLLEFIAENPIRTGKLPPNVIPIARALIEAGAPAEAITKTLALVASGRIARESGRQESLIGLLLAHGADPGPALDAAVSHSEWDAVETLIRHGTPVGINAAAALGRLDTLKTLLDRAPTAEALARAADAAIKGNRPDSIRMLLDAGLPATAKVPGHPFAPTLLHQAAWFNRETIAKLLLERGADPTTTDTQFNGTPAGWAKEAGNAALAQMLSDEAGKPDGR